MSHYFHLVAIRRHETSIYDDKINDHSGYMRDNFVESLRNIKLSEVLLSDCPLHGGQVHERFSEFIDFKISCERNRPCSRGVIFIFSNLCTGVAQICCSEEISSLDTRFFLSPCCHIYSTTLVPCFYDCPYIRYDTDVMPQKM